jgi:glycerol uptake facilitator-like aquaporin
MGDRLSGGNVAIALLANSIATGAALVVLILTFGPISGAHFNPAVSVADATQGGLLWTDAMRYGRPSERRLRRRGYRRCDVR